MKIKGLLAVLLFAMSGNCSQGTYKDVRQNADSAVGSGNSLGFTDENEVTIDSSKTIDLSQDLFLTYNRYHAFTIATSDGKLIDFDSSSSKDKTEASSVSSGNTLLHPSMGLYWHIVGNKLTASESSDLASAKVKIELDDARAGRVFGDHKIVSVFGNSLVLLKDTNLYWVRLDGQSKDFSISEIPLKLTSTSIPAPVSAGPIKGNLGLWLFDGNAFNLFVKKGDTYVWKFLSLKLKLAADKIFGIGQFENEKFSFIDKAVVRSEGKLYWINANDQSIAASDISEVELRDSSDIPEEEKNPTTTEETDTDANKSGGDIGGDNGGNNNAGCDAFAVFKTQLVDNDNLASCSGCHASTKIAGQTLSGNAEADHKVMQAGLEDKGIDSYIAFVTGSHPGKAAAVSIKPSLEAWVAKEKECGQ